MKLWMRLGDQGEYESCDTLEEVVERLLAAGVRAVSWITNIYGGCIAEGFEGRNYISLYWGDDDAQFAQALAQHERDEVNRLLQNEEYLNRR